MDSLETGLKKARSLEKDLKRIVEEELEMLRHMDKDIQVELFNGFAVYSLGDHNLVVATVHNGSYVPNGVELRQSADERAKEEDLFTGELYLPIFLEKGGIWMTSHLSRYFVDLNRPKEKAILYYDSNQGVSNFVVENPDAEKRALEFYKQFYSTAKEIIPGKFLFSGHSMNPEKEERKRGNFCLIYKTFEEGEKLKMLLEEQGCEDVRINDPFKYEEGHFRLHFDSLSAGSVEFEINKDLYLIDQKRKLPFFNLIAGRITRAVTAYID